MKKILITSTDVMMYLFLLPHVKYLTEKNYHVDIACSAAEGFKEERYDQYLRKIFRPILSTFTYLQSALPMP